MNITVFWGVMPCTSLLIFRKNYPLYLQGRRQSQAWKKVSGYRGRRPKQINRRWRRKKEPDALERTGLER
jgi:hypothetical protein